MQVFAFPFYDSKLKQSRFSSVCGKLQDFNLFSPTNRFLPFMIKKPKDGQLIDCIKVLSAHDDSLKKLVVPAWFSYKMFSDAAYDYIFYYGGVVQTLNLACGQYYLQVGNWFSEVFTVHADVSKLLKVEWNHEGNVGEAIYQGGFVQRLYLDAVLADPDYKIEQEGDENGDDEFIASFTRVVKRYKFQTFLLPEFLIDVLHSLPAHSEVTIGTIQGAKQIEPEVDWLVSGCSGTVELTFQEPAAIISKNCSDPLQLVEVDQAGYQVKPWLCGSPDYAAAYWQDTGEERCIQIEETPRLKAWRPADPYCES